MGRWSTSRWAIIAAAFLAGAVLALLARPQNTSNRDGDHAIAWGVNADVSALKAVRFEKKCDPEHADCTTRDLYTAQRVGEEDLEGLNKFFDVTNNFERMSGIEPSDPVWDLAQGVGRIDVTLSDATQTCTGSLISDTYVLTAAHCVLDLNTGDLLKIEHIELELGYISTAQDDAGAERNRRLRPVTVKLELPAKDDAFFHGISASTGEVRDVLSSACRRSYGLPPASADGKQACSYCEKGLDFVLLKIKPGEYAKAAKLGYHPLRLVNVPLGPGQQLMVIHYPMGFPEVLSRRYCRPAEGDALQLGTYLIAHTCGTLFGSSGAPVVSQRHDAIAAIHTCCGNVYADSLNTTVIYNQAIPVSRLARYSREISSLLRWKPATVQSHSVLQEAESMGGKAMLDLGRGNADVAALRAYNALLMLRRMQDFDGLQREATEVQSALWQALQSPLLPKFDLSLTPDVNGLDVAEDSELLAETSNGVLRVHDLSGLLAEGRTDRVLASKTLAATNARLVGFSSDKSSVLVEATLRPEGKPVEIQLEAFDARTLANPRRFAFSLPNGWADDGQYRQFYGRDLVTIWDGTAKQMAIISLSAQKLLIIACDRDRECVLARSPSVLVARDDRTPAEALVVSAGGLKTFKLTIPPSKGREVTSLSPDGKRLIVRVTFDTAASGASGDGAGPPAEPPTMDYRLIDTQTGTVLKRYGSFDFASGLPAFSGDSNRLAIPIANACGRPACPPRPAGGQPDNGGWLTVLLVNSHDGDIIASRTLAFEKEFWRLRVDEVAVSQQARHVIVSDAEHGMKLWSPRAGDNGLDPTGGMFAFGGSDAQFSPDERFVIFRDHETAVVSDLNVPQAGALRRLLYLAPDPRSSDTGVKYNSEYSKIHFDADGQRLVIGSPLSDYIDFPLDFSDSTAIGTQIQLDGGAPAGSIRPSSGRDYFLPRQNAIIIVREVAALPPTIPRERALEYLEVASVIPFARQRLLGSGPLDNKLASLTPLSIPGLYLARQYAGDACELRILSFRGTDLNVQLPPLTPDCLRYDSLAYQTGVGRAFVAISGDPLHIALFDGATGRKIRSLPYEPRIGGPSDHNLQADASLRHVLALNRDRTVLRIFDYGDPSGEGHELPVRTKEDGELRILDVVPLPRRDVVAVTIELVGYYRYELRFLDYSGKPVREALPMGYQPTIQLLPEKNLLTAFDSDLYPAAEGSELCSCQVTTIDLETLQPKRFVLQDNPFIDQIIDLPGPNRILAVTEDSISTVLDLGSGKRQALELVSLGWRGTPKVLRGDWLQFDSDELVHLQTGIRLDQILPDSRVAGVSAQGELVTSDYRSAPLGRQGNRYQLEPLPLLGEQLLKIARVRLDRIWFDRDWCEENRLSYCGATSMESFQQN